MLATVCLCVNAILSSVVLAPCWYPPPEEEMENTALVVVNFPEQATRNNYKCVSKSTCVGGRVWNTGDNLAGCVWVSAGVCAGECKICLGSATPVDVCVREANQSCLTASGSIACCGNTRYEPCYYWSNAETVNGCWCTLFSGSGYDTTKDCWVNNCN